MAPPPVCNDREAIGPLPADQTGGGVVPGGNLTLFEHLEELRRRLLISLAAVSVASLAAYFFSQKTLEFLLSPIRAQIGEVYFFSPAEAFLTRVKVAILTGLVVSAPVVAVQLWLFVSPALRGGEKKTVLPLGIVTSLLFFSGVLFCFYLVMPAALQFLVAGMKTDFLRPLISVTEYVNFLFGMVLAFGIAFNMPVLILALVGLGFLEVRTLRRFHRHAVVLIFIAAAALTPGPDVASQLFLTVPLLALFEASLLAARLVEFRKPLCKEKNHVA